MKMKISEMFCSVQGEGINAGKPAVFLRTALCNLKCSWCDTKYTWDWDNYNYNSEVKEIEIFDIYEKINTFRLKHLIVTGGEPMIQQIELVHLLKQLKKDNYFIEVETNGTILPIPDMDRLVDLWNVSPKLKSSGNPIHLREISTLYKYFSQNQKAYFKYVINSEDDIDEITMIAEKYLLPYRRIILMPQATTKAQLTKMSKSIYSLARKNNYRYSTRLQVFLWENKRGK